jgi:sugar phosphate permease
VTIAAMFGVEPRRSGVASGLINTSQQVGGALGLAVPAALAASHAHTHHPAALTSGFDLAFQVAAAIAAVAAVAAVALVPRPSPTRRGRWALGGRTPV